MKTGDDQPWQYERVSSLLAHPYPALECDCPTKLFEAVEASRDTFQRLDPEKHYICSLTWFLQFLFEDLQYRGFTTSCVTSVEHVVALKYEVGLGP